MVSDVPGDIVVNAGWQGQVEEAVSFCATRQRQQVAIEVGEGTLIIILPTYVRVAAEEGSETVYFSVCHLRSGIQTSFSIYAHTRTDMYSGGQNCQNRLFYALLTLIFHKA